MFPSGVCLAAADLPHCGETGCFFCLKCLTSFARPLPANTLLVTPPHPRFLTGPLSYMVSLVRALACLRAEVRATGAHSQARCTELAAIQREASKGAAASLPACTCSG